MASMDAIGSIAATSVFPSAVSNDYVARQHYADLVFGLQGLVGKGQVARGSRILYFRKSTSSLFLSVCWTSISVSVPTSMAESATTKAEICV